MTDTLSDLLLEARSLLWDGSTIARGACAARITDFLAADRQARQAPEPKHQTPENTAEPRQAPEGDRDGKE